MSYTNKSQNGSYITATRSYFQILISSFVIVAFTLIFISSCTKDDSDKDLPNLIIVLVDTLRADHLHYHGYYRKTSPNIDALAKASQVFLNHYSTASRTGPSVASIFTGLYPRSHGVINPLIEFNAIGILDEKQTTLAEILTRQGYESLAFITNPNVTSRLGFAQGFKTYKFIPSMNAKDVNREVFKNMNARKRKPFFLYLHYMEPHSSYSAPHAYESLFIDPQYRGPITGKHSQLDEIVAGNISINAEDVAQLEGLYDQEIKYFDDELGRLLNFLADEGLRDNTIVLFVADHGEEFLDHGSVLHGYTLYEEQLRVPFFIYDPRRRNTPQIEAITRHVDILPTVLELLGIDYDGTLQGLSLLPLLDGQMSSEWKAPVFAEASLMAAKTIRKQSLLVNGWKLIETEIPAKRKELYHIAVDPDEQNDLISKRPEMAQDLSMNIHRLIESMHTTESKVIKLNKHEIEILRSLGYVK